MLHASLKHSWTRVAMAVAGELIYAIGMNFFIVPLHLYSGGLLGMCQLLRTLIYQGLGVTNGYGTTFGISRDITTEEFATMLARYAKVTGTDTSVDADAVLAKVADGDKVTGYARESVAWAVEQGILAKDGNLIDPQGTIYRARVVKIAVDFQPEQLDTILDTGSNANDAR